jgi:hypothetical protein
MVDNTPESYQWLNLKNNSFNYTNFYLFFWHSVKVSKLRFLIMMNNSSDNKYLNYLNYHHLFVFCVHFITHMDVQHTIHSIYIIKYSAIIQFIYIAAGIQRCFWSNALILTLCTSLQCVIKWTQKTNRWW